MSSLENIVHSYQPSDSILSGFQSRNNQSWISEIRFRGWIPVQTPLGTRPGFETQSRYEAPGDLRVESRIRRSD